MTTWAQIPRIEINGHGTNSTANVILESMSSRVEIFGNIAITKLKLSFHNPSARLLEGTLILPLPEGATVTGFALDINGEMRPAVAVEKTRATAVFESVERRRVDPGLLEKTVGNDFRLRIYPIPARSNRTVEISFQQQLRTADDGFVYQMPMPEQKLKSFEFSTIVYATPHKPRVDERPDGSFDFVRQGNTWQAGIKKEQYKPAPWLRMYVPQMASPATTLLQRAADGTYFFATMLRLTQSATDLPQSNPRTIGIIWDNSLSRLKADKNREKDFLKAYLHGRNVEVHFSTINIQQSPPHILTIRNGQIDALLHLIDTLSYDGGTDLSKLSFPKADEYLLFSDGMANFGHTKSPKVKHIHTISSSASTDHNLLKAISLHTQGIFINLSEIDPTQAAAIFKSRPIRLLSTRHNNSISQLYPLPNTPVSSDMLLITGISRDPAAQIKLLLGADDQTLEHTTIDLTQAILTSTWPVDQIWAAQKIDALEYDPVGNRPALIEIGQKYGIVSSASSLLVLETLEDYLKYGITPPADMQKAYTQAIKRKNEAKIEHRKRLIDYSEQTIKELKEWWATDWSIKKPQKRPKPTPVPVPVVPLDMVETVVMTERENYQNRIGQDSGESATDQDAKTTNKGSDLQGSFTQIEINSDANYMQPMQQIKDTEEGYRKYLTFRELFVSTPSYYLDMARWFFEHDDKERGLLILTNLAELGIEDACLYRTLGYELKKRGSYDMALFVFGEIRRLRPFELQSHRDYALTLVDNDRMQEALDVLYGALQLDYTDETIDWILGVEEVVLMELNKIIKTSSRKLRTNHINPKLIADLPVDIRVVLNWNMDHTDMDLHVTDPTGQTCYYSVPTTPDGGRLSRDITDGLGPEQFILRKAKPGKYKIETNFFGERQVSFTGPTTVMAEVYLYYASGREERQLIVFESPQTGGTADKVLIGTFEFH